MKGISLKILEDFGSKICAENSGEDKSKNSKEKGKKDQDILLRSIKPKVNKMFFKTSVSSIVAISFNLYSVSFVHINKDNKVLSW